VDIEDGTSLVKANSVFLVIILGFLGIPFKYQGHLYTFPSYGRLNSAGFHRYSTLDEFKIFVCWPLERP